ncbi:MAG: pectate lyase, partial [Pedobacter sp.]
WLALPANVIIQNLTIKNVLQGTADNDCVNIKYSHHIWIDHCDLYATRTSDWELYDGLIDITRESDYVTVSWNKLHDSHKAVLIGSGDALTSDAGHLRVTLYKNYFYNVSERQPAARFGYVHSFNNYHKLASGYNGYAIGSTMGATVRTDNNYIEGINQPIRTDFNSKPGYVSGASTNMYKSCGSNVITTSASTWVPTVYSYSSALIPAANVPAEVMAGAGPR